MKENGTITSLAQGWAEAEARQSLIPPGPKSSQNEFGRGDGTGVPPSPHYPRDNVYLKTMLVVTVTANIVKVRLIYEIVWVAPSRTFI